MKRLIDCAMKREKCDLVIRGARIFNVFTGETEEGDLGIRDGKIVGIGSYEGERVYSAEGLYALPSFIDSHIHVESSQLSPEEFAKYSVAHGTSVIIADPHEIVNVCGVKGAKYMKEAFRRLNVNGVSPLDVKMQLPSCVPATPFETSGAVIGGDETAREMKNFNGLGEMMNYPGVIAGDGDTLKKIEAAHSAGKIVDGHAPAVTGDALNAYAAAGIRTDHECLTSENCAEKLARGLYVQLRNGSSARNIEGNAGAVNEFNYRRFLLCSDDRNARDLSTSGELDDGLRRLVASGVPARQAICIATLNAAECYDLKEKGALAPSYDADVVLVKDLKNFDVSAVFKRGVLVAEHGEALFETKRYFSRGVKGTVRLAPVTADDFKISYTSRRVRALRALERSVVTGEDVLEVECREGDVLLKDGVLKLAVLERHFATGNMGKCLVTGYGFHGGALGITVAHDSHNMVIVGDNNEDMARVALLLERAGGGMAISGGNREDVFAFDIAGLMSSLSAEEVVENTNRLNRRAYEMGTKAGIEPFMTMAFLSLAVIPKLRLTDKGLVDVETFSVVDPQLCDESR